MCGIVAYIGGGNGVRRVLDALELLTYRAPDSSGIAILTAENGDEENGRFAIRRAVGGSVQLQAYLRQNPLPDPASPIVVGHGRWAMVGAVTVENAHPILDRSGTRLVCENGSHNATLMLGARVDQDLWWREQGIPVDETVHRSQNTSEMLAYEWERMGHMLAAAEPPPGSADFLAQLNGWQIDDPEERALRLAVWRLREGNAHACAFYGRSQPHTLYVTSHHKPIALVTRPDTGQMMVASDVNAALMLWSKAEVAAASARIRQLRMAGHEAGDAAIQAQSNAFAVDVVFLDDDLYQGEQLFARVDASDPEQPTYQVTRYDGAPVAVTSRRMTLNPAMAGKNGHASYTEHHIAEIPDVLDRIVQTYVDEGQIRLASSWRGEELLWPGLNELKLQERFGPRLERLHRLLLIGEGSSWRDAQAAAPLFRDLLPQTVVIVHRPVAALNLGAAIDPAHDLALEISWSGTTDSLLKVDAWLGEMGVMRVAVTGRPQSDLGRRVATDGGVLDVLSGIEVSVATVKGYAAILLLLYLLALALAEMAADGEETAVSDPILLSRHRLGDELTYVIPERVRALLNDTRRREYIRRIGERCRLFNKVAVLGHSPVDIEAELKIEELAQVVAGSFDFHTASLRALYERSALQKDERRRTLFIINATDSATQREAQFVINYLRELGVYCIVHTTPHPDLEAWREMPHTDIIVSPAVSPRLQPLLDAIFFFDLAVALAYGRGLTAEEIDRPRNLAKSVTTTGAERRAAVEARREFRRVTMAEFAAGRQADEAWDAKRETPSRAALRATVALRAAIAVLSDPLPPALSLPDPAHLVLVAATEATENAGHMAWGAWHALLGVDLTVYRRFLDRPLPVQPDTTQLHLREAGAVLAVRAENEISLPTDLSPFQTEMLGAVYLIGLAVRLARQQGADTAVWAQGLARLPLLLAEMLADVGLTAVIRRTLAPFVAQGYDKMQIIGGGQDHAAARSIARSLRGQGFMAEELYTDSAWHGPLATVGGPGADRDALILILATDPLFQAAALVDTQVYRTRHAPVILVVPAGQGDLEAVQGVGATAVWEAPPAPRPFLPPVNAALGHLLAAELAALWEER